MREVEEQDDTAEETPTDLYRERIRQALGLDVAELSDDDRSSMSAALMLVHAELYLLAMGHDTDSESIVAFAMEAETAVGDVGMPAFLDKAYS